MIITASTDHTILLWLIQTLQQAPGQSENNSFSYLTLYSTNLSASRFSQFFSGALCAGQIEIQLQNGLVEDVLLIL